MNRTRRIWIAVGLAGSLALAQAQAADPGAGTSGQRMLAYASETEFIDALARWGRRAEAQRERRSAGMGAAMADGALAEQMAPAAPVAKSMAAPARAEGDAITNVQTAGVDEGGIVKKAGDYLVVLRRGRLFTLRVGGDALQPLAQLDAYAPGSNPAGAWYDELLIAGQTVVVVGYSYARGGTEIGLFELDRAGGLAYRATYHLRSFDYYSSRNYASRLIGNKLVFYSPTLLWPGQHKPWQQLPGLRRWQGQGDASGFERILPATRIYRSDDDFDPAEPLALHNVTSCDLGTPPLRCESSAVLGPAGRVFYVAPGSVYVWTSSSRRAQPQGPSSGRPAPKERSVSALFRLPLDGSAPSAIKTAGVPVDQMSFLEDGTGHLNVLLRQSGSGEGMWGSESTRGNMALLRLPLAALGDGSGSAQREHYRALPAPAGAAVQNRFVGDWLLWGGAYARWSALRPERAPRGAWALRYGDASSAPQALLPGHDVERIEALGRDAVLVGGAGADLHFSSVRLARDAAELAGRHVQRGATQGETRSHGFFYRADDDEQGLLGLPVVDAGARPGGVKHGRQGSAAVLFLRARDGQFSALGRLEAQDGAAADDACKASCVDWYGNARPIFIGERVFALLGYELVEGRVSGGRWSESIDERRRVSFAPQAPWRDARYDPFN